MNTIATDPQFSQNLKWPILGLCVIAMVLSFMAMPDYTEPADAWGYALRFTARIAFVLLMLAYIARPLQRLVGKGGVLLRNRRYLGLAMALAHTVHFVCVYVVVVWYASPLEPLVLIGGGGAFVTMWLMALTSNNRSQRAFGRNWKRLHTFGMHYLWIIFMNSFAGRIGPDDPYFLYLGLTLFGLAGLGLRVWAFWHQRLRSAT